jgi:hypothetical protein
MRTVMLATLIAMHANLERVRGVDYTIEARLGDAAPYDALVGDRDLPLDYRRSASH